MMMRTINHRYAGSGEGDLLTISDVAKQLHVHRNTVRTWANQGLLPTYRVGPRGDRRFKKRDVDAFVRHCREVGSRRKNPGKDPITVR